MKFSHHGILQCLALLSDFFLNAVGRSFAPPTAPLPCGNASAGSWAHTHEPGGCCAKVGNPTVVPSRMMDKEVRGGEILMDLVPTPFGGRYAHHIHTSD